MNINEYQNYHETKAHTSAEFPYNTYLCSIPLDFPGVPPHWHDELELVVIKKGQGFVSVDFDKRLVHSGEIVMIRPGCLHAIEQMILLKWNMKILFSNQIYFLPGQTICACFNTLCRFLTVLYL